MSATDQSRIAEKAPKSWTAVELLGQHSMYALGTAVRGAQYLRRPSPAALRMGELRTKFYVDVWTAAAEAAGTRATIIEGSLLEVSLNPGRLLIRRNMTSLDDGLTVELSENKSAVTRLLISKDIPVPRHLEVDFRRVTSAWRFVSSLGTSAVVKPALRGIGGWGVTTDVRTRPDLAVAMGFGRVQGPRLLVEEMLVGSVYRLLYFDGELLDAVVRSPAHVVGDGKTTIRGLIERENERRSARGIEAAQEPLRIDRDMRHSLRTRGHTLRSVPSEGEVVRLKWLINDNSREDNSPALPSIGPALARTGAQAAAAVGLRLAGVDIITPDPGVALSESGGAVLEVNHGPGLYYHYMNSGSGTPIALMILERLLNRHG